MCVIMTVSVSASRLAQVTMYRLSPGQQTTLDERVHTHIKAVTHPSVTVGTFCVTFTGLVFSYGYECAKKTKHLITPPTVQPAELFYVSVCVCLKRQEN